MNIDEECTACSGSGYYCGSSCGACEGTGKEHSDSDITEFLTKEVAELYELKAQAGELLSDEIAENNKLKSTIKEQAERIEGLVEIAKEVSEDCETDTEYDGSITTGCFYCGSDLTYGDKHEHDCIHIKAKELLTPDKKTKDPYEDYLDAVPFNPTKGE